MIKVLWLIKRNPQITAKEFQRWWVDVHGPEVVTRQGRYLKKYTYRVPVAPDGLPSDPAPDERWDGVAEQWFDDAAGLSRSLAEPVPDEIVADIRAHMGEAQRFVFDEKVMI